MSALSNRPASISVNSLISLIIKRMYCSGNVLQWECTPVGMYCSGNVLKWECTAVGMYCIGNVLQWECTALGMYCSGNEKC